ncbi:MAG: GNAT family N-acetyltransferase [Caldilineaceae bacterium]
MRTTFLESLNFRQFMLLQTGTLFKLDDAERLLCINEEGSPPAPFFFMGRTPHGHVWRLRHDAPAALEPKLAALCEAEPMLFNSGVQTASQHAISLPLHYDAIKQLIGQYGSVENEWRGPAYFFPDDIPVSERTVRIDQSNLHLAQGPFAWLHEEWHLVQPGMAWVERDAVASVCFSSRLTPHAAEAGLWTAEEYRGRGYAAAVVAAWARAVQQSGRRPLYSTSWDNLASQAVARKLGLIFYGEDWSLR